MNHEENPVNHTKARRNVLVVLPCEIGEEVTVRSNTFQISRKKPLPKFIPCTIVCYMVTRSQTLAKLAYIHDGRKDYTWYPESAFGDSVFKKEEE